MIESASAIPPPGTMIRDFILNSTIAIPFALKKRNPFLCSDSPISPTNADIGNYYPANVMPNPKWPETPGMFKQAFF
jgi:hypothetical protein